MLLTTEMGAEKQVSNDLRKIKEVKEVYSLLGVYDVIAQVKAVNMDELHQVITNKIKKIDTVKSTLTLLATESDKTNLQEELILAHA